MGMEGEIMNKNRELPLVLLCGGVLYCIAGNHFGLRIMDRRHRFDAHYRICTGGYPMTIKETDLAKPVVDWLLEQNWQVYQEVQFDSSGDAADIVAVRNGIIWIIETKTTFGFSVLEQAARWSVHYRSVAVPWARARHYRVAEYYYQVGVIEIYKDDVQEVVKAPLIRINHQYAKKHLSSLLELHKTFSPAGSAGRQHLTPYKYTMMEVRKVIEANPGCTISFLFEYLGRMHYGSKSSFKGNIVKALVDFEKDWCFVDMESKPYKLFIKTEVKE